MDWLSLAHPQLGTWSTTQACALTGNQTSDLSVCGLMPNPLGHTSQAGLVLILFLILWHWPALIIKHWILVIIVDIPASSWNMLSLVSLSHTVQIVPF